MRDLLLLAFCYGIISLPGLARADDECGGPAQQVNSIVTALNKAAPNAKAGRFKVSRLSAVEETGKFQIAYVTDGKLVFDQRIEQRPDVSDHLSASVSRKSAGMLELGYAFGAGGGVECLYVIGRSANQFVSRRMKADPTEPEVGATSQGQASPTQSPSGQAIGTVPTGTQFMIARCKDETRQGQLGPYRDQQAVVWVSVPREVIVIFERAPKETKNLRLSDPVFAGLAPIAKEAIKLAGDRCGISYPRTQQGPGNAFTNIIVFKERLPAGGPIRPEEKEASIRSEDSHLFAAGLGTSDGINYGLINNMTPEAQAQLRSSLEAKRRMEATRVAEQDVEKRMDTFFAKYGVNGLVDSDALQRNPFAFEGKPVAILVSLVQMLDATKAVLSIPSGGYVVMSDTARGTFTERAYFVVVGKVLGNTNFEGNPFGRLPIPHLKFLTASRCKAQTIGSCF